MTPVKLRQLPSFADLFLLPKSFDRGSRTRLDVEHNGIRAHMSSPEDASAFVEHVNEYPHVYGVQEYDEVLIRAREAANTTVLVQWPDGRGYGAVLYEGGFFTVTQEGDAVGMLASGRNVNVIKADQSERMLDPIRRYFENSHLRA